MKSNNKINHKQFATNDFDRNCGEYFNFLFAALCSISKIFGFVVRCVDVIVMWPSSKSVFCAALKSVTAGNQPMLEAESLFICKR